MQLKNIKKSTTGSVSFDAKFKGMRQEQNFVVGSLLSDRVIFHSDSVKGAMYFNGRVDYFNLSNTSLSTFSAYKPFVGEAGSSYKVDHFSQLNETDIIENYKDLLLLLEVEAS